MKRKKTGPKPKVTPVKLKQYLRDNRTATALQASQYFRVTTSRIYQVSVSAGLRWTTVRQPSVEGL